MKDIWCNKNCKTARRILLRKNRKVIPEVTRIDMRYLKLREGTSFDLLLDQVTLAKVQRTDWKG